MEAMKPVKVYSSAERIEADMLVMALKDNHISAYRQGVGSGGYLDIYSGNSVFGEEIFVDEADVQAAKEIIEGIVGKEAPEESRYSTDQEAGGDESSVRTWAPVRIFVLLAAIFLIAAIIFSITTNFL